MKFATPSIKIIHLPDRFFQILMAASAGFAFFLCAVYFVTRIFQWVYSDQILPGVSVADVDLSGLSPDEAALQLDQNLTYPDSGLIVFHNGNQVWVAKPVELGMTLQEDASAMEAYRIGRSGGLFASFSGQMNAIKGNLDIPAVVVFDQRMAYRYLQKISTQIEQPMLEADLHLIGTQVDYTPGQIGRVLNIEATLENLTTQLQSFRDGQVTLVIEEQTPLVIDASAEAQILSDILSAPLTLTLPDIQSGDPGPWEVDISEISDILLITRVMSAAIAKFQIEVNTPALQTLLEQITEQIDQKPLNARFIFNDDTRQLDLIQPAVIGRTLDVAETQKTIEQMLLQGEHVVPLKIIQTQPEVGNDATAASLGISELVSDPNHSYTFFRGSSADRIQNIQIASAQFHGQLIPPNATFSMAEVLGDVSLENGYAEALIIYNGRTIRGVGGGVCQVSTTLFRTVFFAGYPINKRTPHAYRVGYYEQTQSGHDPKLAGLDATVFVPLVDFVFTNDTPNWLLMEVYVNLSERRITWKFYSTSDKRTVDWDTTGLQDVVPAPEPAFQENPDLAPGEMKQVDWPADGAVVTVTRTVYRQDVQLFSDTFRTQYKPWQAVCEYGPGTTDPEGLAVDLDLCQP